MTTKPNGNLPEVIAPEVTNFDELSDWLWQNINEANIAEFLEERGIKFFNARCAGKTNTQIAITFSRE